MLLEPTAFAARLRDFERSAWRFEAQPVYTMPAERKSLARFLAGEPKPDDHNIAWRTNVQGIVASGRNIGRVRTVRRPLNDYQRYQLAWGIPGNVEAGEDIRILDVTDADLGLPVQDFWLFDGRIVVNLNFRPDGTLVNIEQVDEPDLARYLAWQRTAMAAAVSFNEWNA